MERIKALIDKLYHQKELGCTAAQLLPTVQLLQSEILQLQQKNSLLGTAKVAVTMPVNFRFTEELVQTSDVVNREIGEVKEEEPVFVDYKEPQAIPPVQETPKQNEYVLRRPVVREELVQHEEQPGAVRGNYYSAFTTAEEIPTLVQHQSKKELHELIADKKESLNDRLKQEKTEVANVLKDAPIKDLRKGIGINERFSFVSELFRGDEAMYERSIKTINNFGILSEAEYWINRELKYKLGWDEDKPEVQHFYHLVRRRFS
jgi:hypothetical protein